MATLTYVCQNIIYVGMAIFRVNSESVKENLRPGSATEKARGNQNIFLNG